MSKGDTQATSMLVTGAGRRLGLLTCRHFLNKGFKIIAVTRAMNSELAALTALYPTNFEVCECNTYDAGGALRVVQQLGDCSFDILINNASYFVEDTLELEEKVDQYQAFFDVHMLFPMLLSDWFAMPVDPTLHRDRVIINMSDIYSLKPAFEHSLYCSTKAGLDNLTQSLAIKFAPEIRVNSIQPGPLAFLPEHTDEQKTKVIQQTPLGTEGGFEVVLSSFEYIIDNHYLTGSAIKIDGGRSLVR
jgi:dihydromonapterin reductase/dihydrofolate reductase